MTRTKIQLLPAEMELVSTPDFILTKNEILKKIKAFLEEIQSKQHDIIQHHISFFPVEVIKILPKISRGENYRGLPWLVLDNPRFFQHSNIFAIRTLFWWGNYFSITLHISGKYKETFTEKILKNYSIFSDNKFYIANGIQEWDHNFDSSSYNSLKDSNYKDVEDVISKSTFIKIGIKFPIIELSSLEGKLLEKFELLVKCLD